ncbi:MAG: TaqI-like C-terminal specificity domain-containing protein [bacterium]|nr:TaqI-like C-terminal specificity domain-containing protein [bacterium]
MILRKTYNRERFINFVTEFLPDLYVDEREIKTTETKSSDIESAYLLGENRELDLKVFEIKHTGTSKRRVGLTLGGFQIMRRSGAFRALIAFYSEDDDQWRFSLMTLTPKRNEKAKLTIERSSPKRYSFILGPNSKTATPEKFLISKGSVSNFEDLQSRFSLEVVNKDFYKKISELFTKLVGGTVGNRKSKNEYEPLLKLPSIQDKSQTSLEFAVRLIGRVIFCWFLREKKSKDEIALMPLSLLSHEAALANGNYYHSVLEPIFFEVLNKPIKERKEMYTQNGFNSIPYLNGGLFTPHYDDFFNYNEGKQAIFNNIVRVPDTWLQEFFEFLETYNFTIDENISFDEELSIDPEMLGRIFENLLAEINPETGESARKSTGSYYTPRTIVDYMVDESLYAYLSNKTGIGEEKIRAVISYDLGDDTEYPLTEEEQKNITEALHQIKILDPACGSGAFPMGMLQKIVFILQQTDPDGKNWFKKQIQHASPEIRRAIEREFENKNFDYIRKLGIIRENIFGVDIQPIATEISRLRCFLTLIVDESIDDNAENRGIEPLPNLDFKFVTANTLIVLPQSSNSKEQANLFEDEAGITELQELRDLFFSSTGAERDKLKFEFVQVQKKMLDHLIQSDIRGHAELTSKLTTWDPFSHQASSWFDPEWMFGVKEGFDIAIANPPYVTTKYGKISNEFKRIYQENFETAYDKLDLYVLFIEKAVKILKNDGLVTFITPWNFLSNFYSFKIRKFLLDNTKIRLFMKLPPKVFGTIVVDNVISIFQKSNDNTSNKILIDDLLNKDNQIFIEQKKYLQNDKYIFNLTNDNEANNILDKMKLFSKPLGDLALNYIGIMTGGQKDMISKSPIFQNSKPVLGGKDIDKWILFDRGNYVNFDKSLIHSNDNEKVYLANRKILLRKTGRKLTACLDEKQFYTIQSLYNIVTKDKKYKEEYLLALLNSKLFTYIYNKFFITNPEVFPYIKRRHLDQFPIHEASESKQKPFIDLVNLITSIKSDGDHALNAKKQAFSKEYEAQIDQLVYQLYGLTSEEIKIVEDSSIK